MNADEREVLKVALGLVRDLERAWGRARQRLEVLMEAEPEIREVRGHRQRQIAAITDLFNPNGLTATDIARRIDYDEANVYAVLDSLVEAGLLEEVTGPVRRWRMAEQHRRDRLLLASRLIPQGRWTTYGDVAIAVFENVRMAKAVGQSAAHNPAFAHPHRVIGKDGIIPAGWSDGMGGGPEVCRERLEAEGVAFVNGRADPSKRLGYEELQDLLREAERGSAEEDGA